MSLNPILALDHVLGEYREHLKSEFRARDEKLRRAMEAELERPLFLAQEPFYQAHRPFQSGRPWRELPLDPALARAMAERSRSDVAFLHQSESVEHLLGPSASPLVVTTGTGSGKSECFLLPVIQNAIEDARMFHRPGLTAILVYPMNALANDQEKRIREYLEAAGVGGSVDVRKYDRGTSQSEREELRRRPPRILLTNYMMLEYLLIRPADRDDLFANHRCRFLVLDEVHTYRGVLGSNIALLLRRVRAHLARARQDWGTDMAPERHGRRYPRLLAVGTSATIKSSANGQVAPEERVRLRDAAVKEFFQRVTGEEASRVRVIGEVLQEIPTPPEASMSGTVPEVGRVDASDVSSVEWALAASAGVTVHADLRRMARHCGLLWRLNHWLVARPMSLSQLVDQVLREVPERRDGPREAVAREVEAVLLAGAALPDTVPGSLRLRAHRLIRGGWRFVRCIDPSCGRIYPMGEPGCECGRRTAPLYLCRNCGADYLRLSGDPAEGALEPYAEGEASRDEEWMLYDVRRHEMETEGETDADVEVQQEADTGSARQGRPRRERQRIETVRGQPVHAGSFDAATLHFSNEARAHAWEVRLVHGRTRCLCCGGTAGSRNVITPVALGTSAAIKVLGEGLVEALARANAHREGHDGKERLLIFSDSRQDAAHQARFIIFASRYDRMRRRLFDLVGQQGPLGIQRAVELLGDAGVRFEDNPHAPEDRERRLTEDDRLRIRCWEEAPLLDEISATPFFRGTLINLGVLAVGYAELEDEIRQRGGDLCQRWGISPEQLAHVCRCLLDELRVRSMLSREMMRYHPRNQRCPEAFGRADWERKVASPKGLPVDAAGHPLAHFDADRAPGGVTIRQPWRSPGGGGREPSFQRLIVHLLSRLGAPHLDEQDGLALLRFLMRGSFIKATDVYGIRESARVAQLNDEQVRLWRPTASERLRCDVCSWPMSGAYPSAPCPRCSGTAAPWPDAEVQRHRTVRRLSQLDFQPLVADEHTAQVTHARREDLERRFKAPQREAPLNVLACSPTMEMGIDVGGLDAVILRNVPPRPDNYAQRGGRAGRRTRVGLVVGYARSTPHDQYFYDHPEEMISGEIPAPSISLANRDVIFRHLAAIAFGAAEPGLAGRMVHYIDECGAIKAEAVAELAAAVVAKSDHAVDLARQAWGGDILAESGLGEADLRRFMESVPGRIQDVMERTSRQISDLRSALDRFTETLQGPQRGVRAANLVARMLGVPVADRSSRSEADDASAGYPPRRLAEFGILPGYEFPAEPASLRLLRDAHEESPITAARRFGIYQFMPDAPVYARARRWKVIGLDTSSPWNPKAEEPWHYRLCQRCELRFDTHHPSCPRCRLAAAGPIYPAHEFGGFLAQRSEAPVLDEEDRIGARNLVAFYPQWDGTVTHRWSVGPGWQLVLHRNEEVRWLNEGLEPTDAERDAQSVLHPMARGFSLCGACGRKLIPERPDARPGRRRTRSSEDSNPHGHAKGCSQSVQPPRPAAIVAKTQAEVLRLVAFIPEALGPDAIEEWTRSLGAALRIGIRHHLLLDGSEIEFEPEGPWQESGDEGAVRRVCLTFVDASVGGSGYMERIAREFDEVAKRALQHLQHPNCDTACYRCLKSYNNQRHHDRLQWPLIVPDLHELAAAPPASVPLQASDNQAPGPWLEAFRNGVGSPLELKFLRLFQQHGFHPQRQFPIAPTPDGPPTTIADFAVPERRLAIYIDGAAFHVGDRRRRDQVIRQRLRSAPIPWDVVELRASDLGKGKDLVEEIRNRGRQES